MVPEYLIGLVTALYRQTRSPVRVAEETSDSFEIGVGVHQGCGDRWGGIRVKCVVAVWELTLFYVERVGSGVIGGVWV